MSGRTPDGQRTAQCADSPIPNRDLMQHPPHNRRSLPNWDARAKITGGRRSRGSRMTDESTLAKTKALVTLVIVAAIFVGVLVVAVKVWLPDDHPRLATVHR